MSLVIPTEQVEQQNLVRWLDAKGYKYTAIPNSTYTKSWQQKRRNTAMGLRAGFPDMVVIANGVFMCIELKRLKGGALSTFQKDWIEQLRAAGVPTGVCKGAHEAIAFINATVLNAAS